jgi:5-methyltetrahydropteroyltriglutamate--homocysteine methyltransferase
MTSQPKRILATHAGSLPRPPALTSLYTARSRGEKVDETLMASEGSKAVPWVVAQQRACNLDIISNGEQQRESFVLYLRRRLGGIGGVGDRLPFTDVEAYPKFKEERTRFMAGREAVSNVANLPRCIGALSYQGQAELDGEIADFKAAMSGGGANAAAPFFTAASPGILATIVKDDHYKDVDAYLEAIAQCLRVEYEAIIAAGFTLQIDAPDLAMERHSAFGHKPLGDFQKFIEKIVGAINRALVNIPAEKVRLHACWGNYEGPHDPADPEDGQGRRALSPLRQSPACTRVSRVARHSPQQGTGPDRRRHRHDDQLHGAPRDRRRPARTHRRSHGRTLPRYGRDRLRF